MVTNPFLLHANMPEPRPSQYMKKHAVIVLLTQEHFDSEIASFLKLSRSFAFKVRSELKVARFHLSNVSWKQRCQSYEIIKTPEFASCAEKSLKVDEGTH